MVSNESNDAEFNDNRKDFNFVPLKEGISTSKVLTEEVISLLEERLMVNLTRRKIGEVVVRKEIETHVLQMQVPVRREKLIVEQVSPDYKLLAEVDLGEVVSPHKAIALATDDLGMAKLRKNLQPQSFSLNQDAQPTVFGEISSPQVASDLLDMIAHMPSHNCEMVRIEIVLKNSEHRDTYQALFSRHCKS